MASETIYIPPNVRTVAIRTLQERLEQRRQRRLIDAIETNRLKIAKTEGMVDKDLTKFDKYVASASKRLDAARDMLEKAEQDIQAATNLHNNISLLNTNLGKE